MFPKATLPSVMTPGRLLVEAGDNPPRPTSDQRQSCSFSSAHVPCGARAHRKSYTFGVAIEAGTATKAYENFVKALSERLHQPVTLEVLTTPGEERLALELGKIDIALIKAISYGRAKSENRKVARLVTVVSQNGNEEEVTHSGYIVALQTSHIETLPA